MRSKLRVEHAVALARAAHAGQVDKAGTPYIEHALEVMRAVDGPEAKMAGVLHDVVEDTPVTLDQLRAQGFPRRVIAAVDAVTKRPGEDYEAYLARVVADEIALRVKIADMTDNLDETRIAAPTERDRRRLEGYRQVLPRLQVALHRFDPEP